jgi:mannose-6-phosphate isomerase-like protein (cupin superfamily)
MAKARHEMPPEIAALSLEEIAERYIGRFRDKRGDWEAFEDAKIEGYRRAQHRFIGAGGSGKHDDPTVIPARGFTLSIVYVPPGQGNAAHTHEVEEVFFVLQGYLTVFVEDEEGRRVTRTLGGSGNASPALPGSSMAIRTRASNRSTSRSCSGVAVPRRWGTPTTSSIGGAKRI